MTNRNNTTNTVEIRFEDGEVFGEKHRNSIGGFANMMTRIAERTDCDRIRPTGDEIGGEIVWTAGERRFVVAQVQTFAGAR